MKRKFIVVAGRSFYCDEKGVLSKNAEGELEEKPDTDVDAEEVSTDEGTEEVAKMLQKASKEVKEAAKRSADESQIEAMSAIEKLFSGIAASAKKHTPKVAEVGEASFNVADVKAGLKSLSEKKVKSFAFEIRSTSELNNLTGDVIPPQVVPEIGRAPQRQPFIEAIADVTPNMQSNVLSYVEVVTQSGAPASTSELAAIPEKDFLFQEYKADLRKVAVINKHSVEILKDAPQLVSAIKGWLNEDINLKTDDELLNGGGTAPHLQGVVGVASVLDATAVGTKRVAKANLFDVLRVAMTKIAVAGKGKFVATYAILNPTDADELDLTKDTNGQYILPPFKSADGTTIKGCRIIENTGIAAGTFLIGDFRKLHIGTQGGVEIDMTNSDGTDFAHDILTVKLTRRIASYVRVNDSGAFWTGTIATVKAALVNPS